MKVSVNLSDDEIAFLDSYGKTLGFGSRAAVLHAAVVHLRASQLGYSYADAWATWAADGEAEAWAATVADDGGRPL